MADPNPAAGVTLDVETDLRTASKTVTCKEKMRLLLCPVRSIKNVHSRNDQSTHIIIGPDAFRIWFYLGFIIFTCIALAVKPLSELDLNDNPILNRFGVNNICVYFDLPPFAHMSAPLWLPQVFNLLLFEWFDFYRVYDDYYDEENDIDKCFFKYYTICSILESIFICFFIESFAGL